MVVRFIAITVFALFWLSGCGDDDVPPIRQALTLESTWQWQLQGEINIDYDVDVYDIDLADTDIAVIADLHRAGRLVICYFSAGSYEEWRDDAAAFPVETLGQPLDGWEGERWVDVRAAGVRSVMIARLDLAVAKGCNGVEPDNVTAYHNDSGFDITSDDQLDFNRFLAEAAHHRSLLIALKNDLEQIPALVDEFDFAVNEECLQYDECGSYQPFSDAGKPVFNAEYADDFVNDPTDVCRRARALGLRTLILALELDDSVRISCDTFKQER